MKYFGYLLVLFGCSSCQFFDTEKISSEQFYEEEVKTITWNEVDQYPSFEGCTAYLEKQDQQSCFMETLSNHLQQSIKSRRIVAMNNLKDMVSISFSVGRDGVLTVLHIEVDSLVRAEFPKLGIWLRQSIDSLQPTAPAYKRGIPVKTKFTLPVVLTTDSL